MIRHDKCTPLNWELHPPLNRSCTPFKVFYQNYGSLPDASRSSFLWRVRLGRFFVCFQFLRKRKSKASQKYQKRQQSMTAAFFIEWRKNVLDIPLPVENLQHILIDLVDVRHGECWCGQQGSSGNSCQWEEKAGHEVRHHAGSPITPAITERWAKFSAILRDIRSAKCWNDIAQTYIIRTLQN